MTDKENILTNTLCLQSTKSDWNLAPLGDKVAIVEYCTGRLNFKTGNSFTSDDLFELVTNMFSKAAADDTTFEVIMSDSYQSFRDNLGSSKA